MSVFQRISKIIVISSGSFILFCLIFSLILENSNFELAHDVYWFDYFLFAGIPIAAMLTLFSMAYLNNSSDLDLLQSFVTTVIAAFLFVYFTLILFLDLCTAQFGPALYQSKENPAQQIVERSFGCGAVDSTPASISFCILEKYPLGLIYVTQIDTANVNTTKWVRVD